MILYYFIFLSVVECENEDYNSDDCSNVACTLEYRSFSVIITDANNAPVAFDSFQVIGSTNNKDLTAELTDSELQEARQNGKLEIMLN